MTVNDSIMKSSYATECTKTMVTSGLKKPFDVTQREHKQSHMR